MLDKIELPDKVYDVLKIVSIIALPLITLISTFGDIWGLPYKDEIVKTLAAIEVFVGAILAQSSRNYKKKHEKESEGEE